MKKITFILFLAFSLAGKSQNLSEIINSKDVLLVDVRSEKEFKEGSLEEAINIPLENLKSQLSDFQGKKNIVLFCRSGNRSQKAVDFLHTKGITAFNGKNIETIKNLQKVSLSDKIAFQTEKPTKYAIKKGKNIQQIAIALGKNAVLKKHSTAVSATLIVLKGKVRFLISGEEILLNELDTYQIPVDIEHEVIGVGDENLFIVTKAE